MKYFALFFLLLGCAQFKVRAPEKSAELLKVVWSKNLDPKYVSGNLPIGLGAPRIFNDIVYMGSTAGTMNAYDLETGRVIWTSEEKTELGAPVEFFKDHVAYGGLNGRLFVRHYLTGKLKYAIDLGSPIESAPVFHEDHLFIYLRGHQIVHLDAETGKVLWAYKRAVPVTTSLQRVTKPLIVGNKVIVGFADGFLGALSMQEGTLIWETKLADNSKFVDIDLNPILFNGLIVSGSPSGELKAVNPSSGAIARSYGVSVMAHPVKKGETLILGTNEGELLIMGADGVVLKKGKISDQAISSVSWWKDHLVAASFDGMIRMVDPISMKVMDKFAMGYEYSSIFSDIPVTEKYMAIFTSRNHLYIFR